MMRSMGAAAMALLAMPSPVQAVELGTHTPFCGPVLYSPYGFAPGILSGPAHDSAPAFAPDGDTVRDGAQRGEPVWLGETVNSPGSDAEPRLGPDHRTLYFSSERVTQVVFPRSREHAVEDTARLLAWDNGNDDIWATTLPPWLDAQAEAASTAAAKR